MQASCIEKGENSFPIHGRSTHRIIYVRYKTLKTFHDTKLLKEKVLVDPIFVSIKESRPIIGLSIQCIINEAGYG